MDFGAQGYKPENALRRAEELVQQEQPVRALVTLHEVISNKRYRVWQGSLEDIMMKHIDLCISLRKGKYARDGLIQYRAICQQVNVGSLEKVINHFLENADQKAKDAQDKSEIKVTEIMANHDLDAEGETLEEAPETLIMKAVSGESTKDRTDREILMPWIKFLWESYRTALDVTRTNPKLEHIYHDTARKAFKFCLNYQRKVEFRKLCELIRTHHNQQSKYHNPDQRLQLMNNSESFHRYMETRFKQLQVATSLDLWQEAYRSIEDIHGIITFFKKTPQQKQMMEYFDKLTKVFWVAKNYLFHAYACLKYQSLHSRQPPATKGKEISQEEQQTVASKVLLSILCIPFWERKNYNRQKDELFVYNMSREKNMRITTLLGSSTIPTRSSLLMDLNNRKICEVVFKPLKELYEVLEVQFDPLHLCHRIPAVLEFLNSQPKLEGYGEILKQVAAVRMVEQVCKVYDTMKIDDLVKLCPYYTFSELEPILVEVAKSGYPGINLAINHQTQTISFADNQLDCDLLSGELSLLNRKLEPVVAQCIAATAPPKKPTGFSIQYFNALAAQLQSERTDILERKKVIEERKERQEQAEREQARENDVIETKKLEELKNSEAKRMKEEAAAREEQRKKAQEQQEAEQQTRALYTEIVQQKGGVHLKNLVKADESIIKDPDKLIDVARAQLMLAKEEREKRLKEESKRMDYFERACREEERPILEKLWNERVAKELANAQKTFETQKKEHREQWEHSIEEKKRLSKMESYLDSFRKELIQERKKRIEEERKASKRGGKRKETQVQQEEEAEQEQEQEQEQENGGEEREIEDEEDSAPPPVSKPKEERSPSPKKEKKEAAPASGGWRDQAAEPAAAAPPPAASSGGAEAKPGAYVPPSQRKSYVPPSKRS